MHKVDVAADQFAAEAAERRRAAESARKARIFNTRQRVIGLDLEALNQQVREKKHQRHAERHRDKAFDALREYHDDVLLQQDTDERGKRADSHADLVNYWATHQRVEDSLDADLKCGLKGAVRITIPENELGPASMQIFQGEGIGEEQMRREQMTKTERDLQVQMEDNARRQMRNKHREMLVNRELAHQDLMGVQQVAQEEECKKAARIALDNYNLALATEQEEKLKEQHRRDERENLAEMWHTMTSDMMTESAEAAEREVRGGTLSRVLTDRWKGMSPEQLSAIHREREAQRLERQRQRDAEKIQEAAWDLQLLKLSRETEEEELRAAELRRQRRIQMDQDNMQLANEQQAHQEYLNKKLYTNKPSKDYFYQFNTSSR
ncbi:putative RIB43A-like with coiled-coils protein 1 [Scophthalmus maximus]|nr:RIB43A-like with coiled-coils protein 1 isoform X2 [Scophthalmus maximus]XP_035499852.1 RIB43A-like with coiled-coils protein 1 isoform X2 [Scophthalmus maximus]XP_035499853.1 RIB43A-like with coiled-coils protein 1 isoform X2 [Scophthalmus maximus]XP_035499854.1 RIB43A-like with coiled-coils protein 1 isoform X2 [Scophthalmus maximus]AWP09655.1 putative RIB43A-like with coiled-coils protein 1 [Scophthalmus maximus]